MGSWFLPRAKRLCEWGGMSFRVLKNGCVLFFGTPLWVVGFGHLQEANLFLRQFLENLLRITMGNVAYGSYVGSWQKCLLLCERAKDHSRGRGELGMCQNRWTPKMGVCSLPSLSFLNTPTRVPSINHTHTHTACLRRLFFGWLRESWRA